MPMKSRFGAVLEATESLNLEERQELVEVLRRRAVEERRIQLQQEIAQANAQFAQGKCKPATPAQIMRELLK
jgi:hypothetical protein